MRRHRLDRPFETLDRLLTAVLIVLVVCMVLSVSAEIVLNAVVQPVASGLLKRIDEGEAAEAGTREEASSSWISFLRGIVSSVAKLSAPVNTTSQTLLIWVGILGSALAFRLRAHLGVDALVRAYPPRVRLILDHVSTSLVGLFSIAVLVAGGYLLVRRAFSTGSKMPGLEMFNRGWFYLVLVITGVLNLAYCVHHFAHPRVVGSEPNEEEQGDS